MSRLHTIGILFSNLGTPNAPTPEAVKTYLKEFLSDRRVVDVPRLIWAILLRTVILPRRSKTSAHAYQSIWTAEGSPLLFYTKNLAQKTFTLLQKEFPNFKFQYAVGMRYGSPSFAEALETLENCEKLFVLPLYPQYSSATTASTLDAFHAYFKKRRAVPDFHFIMRYGDHPAYVQALTQTIQKNFTEAGKPDRLLFSFHGLPKRYVREGDSYFYECHATAQAVAKNLGLASEDSLITFQSRFGKEEWLRPYTDEVFLALPSQGVKKIAVICPGFSADCLETLEEIAITGKRQFLEAGGKEFRYIPALNDSDLHANGLLTVIKDALYPLVY